MGSPPGPPETAGYEQRKQAVRRWKLEKPQDGQVQSPGLGRFLLGGNGVRISAARSRTRLEDGETSMAFSFKARPFMHRLSAACNLHMSENGKGFVLAEQVIDNAQRDGQEPDVSKLYIKESKV